MGLETTTLVIRQQRTWVRRLIWIGLIAAAPLALYIAFEIGRRSSGYSALSSWQSRQSLQSEIKALNNTVTGLRRTVAELETGRVSEQQERMELARSVGELQAQVARQTQDINFYRGIVGSTVGGSPSIKIQRLAVQSGAIPNRYRLRIVLVPATRADKTISGTLNLSVQGMLGTQAVTYALANVSADKREQVPFSFRYFEDVEQEIVLPQGFQPKTVKVEVKTSGSVTPPLNQSFTWNVQAG